MNLPKGNKISLFIGVAIGALYGLFCQFVLSRDELKDWFTVMTMGFVFILPIALGVITLYFANTESQSSWAYRIFMPWATASLCLLLSFVTGMEGTICLIMAVPIYLPLASLGGIIGGAFFTVYNANKMNSFALGALLLMPFIVSGVEERYPLDDRILQVNTSILINAPSEIVWSQITRIPKITEPQESFFYTMGFPRPVEATLSYEGIGGIREAKFEKGLMFLETITDWEKEKKLTFKIRSEPANTPLTTLDSHVVVGGRYFDTLIGQYEIERISANQIKLHLFSRYRLSTRFNFYAEVWSDFLMRDIQQNILRVIRSRSEGLSSNRSK